jgi:hypothetical protein
MAELHATTTKYNSRLQHCCTGNLKVAYIQGGQSSGIA